MKYSAAMRVLGILALGLVVLGFSSGQAAAQPPAPEKAPYRVASFTVPASNGYRFKVSRDVTGAPERRLPNFFVEVKGHHYWVQYSTSGTSTDKGNLNATFQGLGRIAVRFEERSVVRRAVPDNCEGPPNIVRRGIFRGVIRFRGEQDYTSVDRQSARGKIVESFKKVCDEGESHSGQKKRLWPTVTTLVSGGSTDGRAAQFSAWHVEAGRRFWRLTNFNASFVSRHDGVTAIRQVSAERPEAVFSTTGEAEGLPTEAFVQPPFPFVGSATFHLDSPNSATWSGTLGVDMPGIGEVPLSGPGSWAAVCVDAKCTKTIPPNVGVAVGFEPNEIRILGRTWSRSASG